MEQQLQPQTPAPAPTGGAHSSSGGIIAIVIIIALIVVGAFYVWGQKIAQTGGATPEEQEMIDGIQSQDSSTEPTAIEADLEAQSANDFDQDFDTAYAELDAAFTQ